MISVVLFISITLDGFRIFEYYYTHYGMEISVSFFTFDFYFLFSCVSLNHLPRLVCYLLFALYTTFQRGYEDQTINQLNTSLSTVNSGNTRTASNSTNDTTKCLFKYASAIKSKTRSSTSRAISSRSVVPKKRDRTRVGTASTMARAHSRRICTSSSSEAGGVRAGPRRLFGNRLTRADRSTVGKRLAA